MEGAGEHGPNPSSEKNEVREVEQSKQSRMGSNDEKRARIFV